MFKVGDEVVLDDNGGKIKFSGYYSLVLNEKRVGKITQVINSVFSKDEFLYTIDFSAVNDKERDITLYMVPSQYVKASS